MPDYLAEIRDAADALCNPKPVSSPRHEWDANRHKVPLQPHEVTLPGLIQQLRDLCEPGAADDGPGARSIPDSRPPADLDAVSLLAVIEFGAARRCLQLGVPTASRVESTIWDLVSAAPRAFSTVQREMVQEFRSWRNQAEVICRWRTGAVDLRSPCPATVLDPRSGEQRQCGARTLLANADTYAAWCMTCGSEWPPEDFERLRGMLRGYHDRSRAAADGVRERVRATKVAAAAAMERARNGGRGAA